MLVATDVLAAVRAPTGLRVAVANLKGGTGKTTTAVHLACRLAEDRRTLLIDADPQQSALVLFERAGRFHAGAVGLPVRLGASRGSAIPHLFPVVAIALGVLFRDERLHRCRWPESSSCWPGRSWSAGPSGAAPS